MDASSVHNYLVAQFLPRAMNNHADQYDGLVESVWTSWNDQTPTDCGAYMHPAYTYRSEDYRSDLA